MVDFENEKNKMCTLFREYTVRASTFSRIELFSNRAQPALNRIEPHLIAFKFGFDQFWYVRLGSIYSIEFVGFFYLSCRMLP